MRGLRVTAATLLAASAALVGCGATTHENEPRPPIPTSVSVKVGEDSIEAKAAIGRGVGEPGARQPYVSQNANAPQNQSDPEAPAAVSVAIANLTSKDTVLRLQGPVERDVELTPNGSASFRMDLPSGVYLLSSPASRGTTRLNVGPSRVSSSGDVLLP